MILQRKSQYIYTAMILMLLTAYVNPVFADTRFTENIFTQNNPGQNYQFGHSTAVSGSYAICTSIGEPDSPGGQSAVFFSRSNEEWTAASIVVPIDSLSFENYGFSCDINGNYAVVSAHTADNKGAVYTYFYNGTSWLNTSILTHINLSIGDMFGYSVSLQQDRLIIGAPGDDESANNAGAVYIYNRSGNTWVFDEKIVNPSTGIWFGYEVNLYQDYLAVSSLPDENNDNDYNVFVYNYDNSLWTMQEDIAETTTYFGHSIALSDSKLLIGAGGDNEQGQMSGSVYFFERNGSDWTETEKFYPPTVETDDFFGSSIDMFGNIAIIGAPGTDNSFNRSGYACYYEYDSNNWILRRILTPSNNSIGDFTGKSVSISSGDVFIGCPFQDNIVDNAGSVLHYRIPDFNVDFYSNKRRATIGDSIQFYSGAVGNISSYAWDFDNDGVIDSDEENPKYSFSSIGSFDVKLTVSEDFENRTILKPEYIKIRQLWENETKLIDSNPLFEGEFGKNFAFDGANAIVHSTDYSTIVPVNRISFLRKNINTWNQIQDIIIDTSYSGPVDVDIHGEYAVLGSAYDYDHGYCYVFHFDGVNWNLHQSLKPFDNAEYARCGGAVSLSDNLLACGAEEGRVYLWKLVAGQWIPDQTIEPDNNLLGQGFGNAVEIHDNKIFVGAPFMDYLGLENSGGVYIYEHNGTEWIESDMLTPMEPMEDEYFGSDIKLSGNYMIIGKFRQPIYSSIEGAAYMFFNNNGTWSEQQKIFPELVSTGSMFGRNVDIAGDYAIIGASFDSDFIEESGAALLYKREGYSWHFQSKLNAEDICARAKFGHRVSFNNNEVIISAIHDSENGTKTGALYLYPYEQIQVKNIDNELEYTVFKASNYPNPFNPRTTIRFSIASNQNVKVAVYNLKGQKVKTLLNKEIEKGTHEIIWNGDNNSGKQTGSGVYFYKITPERGNSIIKKCVMLK